MKFLLDFKKSFNIGGALIVILLIFLGIGYIVTEPSGVLNGKDKVDLSFLRNIRPSELNERDRIKPKKPPKVEKQPDIPKPKVAKINKPQNPRPQMQAVPLALGLDLGTGPFIGGVGVTGSSDSEMVPIVKVDPQYPREAAMKGVEGFVQMLVDIQPDGSVSNVRVVSSSPRRVFNRAAVSAASKYKYKPPVKNGKPYAVKGHGIQIDFKLDGV